MRDKRTVEFKSTIARPDAKGESIDLEVTVTCTVYWTESDISEGFRYGYVVEDIEARQAGPFIELSRAEIAQFEQEAIAAYLK